jgi:hypothetical protein
MKPSACTRPLLGISAQRQDRSGQYGQFRIIVCHEFFGKLNFVRKKHAFL